MPGVGSPGGGGGGGRMHNGAAKNIDDDESDEDREDEETVMIPPAVGDNHLYVRCLNLVAGWSDNATITKNVTTNLNLT